MLILNTTYFKTYLLLSLVLNNGLVTAYSEFPQLKDLKPFTGALINILNFYENDLVNVDINDALGLHLTIVQLSLTGVEENFQEPDSIYSDLKHALQSARGVLFHYLSKISNQETNARQFSSFFLNTKGVSHQNKVVTKQLSSMLKFNKSESFLLSYIEKLNDTYSITPNPNQSYACLVALSLTPSREISAEYRLCHLDSICNDILLRGTNFGYALSHRILLFVLAHSSKHCFIFSPSVDKTVVQDLCSNAFQESLFMTENFRPWFTDVYLEHITLCSYLGYAEFIQQSWLYDILPLQTDSGCMIGNLGHNISLLPYATLSNNVYLRNEKFRQKSPKIHNITCNKHMTAVSAASLAAGIKYILKTYL